MENKYQEALDITKNYIKEHSKVDRKLTNMDFAVPVEISESLTSLQELIDKYNSIKDDYMSYKDLKAEYESELELYKKALDILLDKFAPYFMKERELVEFNYDGMKSIVLNQARKELENGK